MELIKGLVDLNRRIGQLSQSKDEKYKSARLFGLIFFGQSVFISIVMLCLPTSNTPMDAVVKGILCYFRGLTLCWAILSFATYGYVFAKKKTIKNAREQIYRVLVILSFIISIPAIAIFSLIEISSKYRSTRVENLAFFWVILFVEIVLIVLISKCSFLMTDQLVKFFIFILSSIGVSSAEPFMTVIAIFAMYKFEVDLFTCLILKLIEFCKVKTINKKNLSQEQHKNSLSELNEDLVYLKKTFWKMQLLVLIGIFFVVTVSASIGEFEVVRAQIKDAITLITLFMLYWDKREQLR